MAAFATLVRMSVPHEPSITDDSKNGDSLAERDGRGGIALSSQGTDESVRGRHDAEHVASEYNANRRPL